MGCAALGWCENCNVARFANVVAAVVQLYLLLNNDVYYAVLLYCLDIVGRALICSALLCYALLCYAMLCFASLASTEV